MSTLGTAHITTLDLDVPGYGSWHADVVLDGGDVPAGNVVLTAGDLVLNGQVLRGDFDAGDKPHVVVVGGLGWQGLITRPISFQSDSGVLLSTVLAALSAGAGQTIEQPADVTIGSYYECVASRPGEPVRWADALAELAQGGYLAAWRVDPDGVTRFGARTPVAVTARATVIRKDAGAGLTVYGLDAPAGFLPGNTIEGVPIYRLNVRETSGKLEADVYTQEPVALPTIKESIRRMVAAAFENHVRTYVVAAVHSDGRMDLTPPSDAQHLPEMANVEQWIMGGVKYEPTIGQEVIVVFRDKRKTRPAAFGFKLSDGPFAGLARLQDSVVVMLPPANFSGTIGGSPASGLVVWSPGQTMGTITTSSAKSKGGP